MTSVRRLTLQIANVLLYIGAAGLLLMTAIIGWQVFGRYVLNASPDWSEQAALTLMIWYVCFGAAAGVREGFHIRIVALERAVGPKTNTAMRTTNELVVGLCGAAMLVYGTQLVLGTWQHNVPTLGIPRGLVYLPIPVSGLLIVLFSIERLFEVLSPTPPENEEDPRWS